MKTKTKVWYQGCAEMNEKNSIHQLSMECRYINFEKLENGRWLLGIINADNSTMTFHLVSKDNIDCRLEEEEVKAESFPFVEQEPETKK